MNIYDDVAIKDKETVTTYALCRVLIQNKNNDFAVNKKLGFDRLVKTCLIADLDVNGDVDTETIRPYADNEFAYLNLENEIFTEEEDPDLIIVKITEVIEIGIWE